MTIKYLTALCIALCVVFSPTLNAAEISKDARRHMARGQAAMENASTEKDYQDAVREFKKAIGFASEWPDAWFNLGVAQEAAGDYEGAIGSFQSYLRINPSASDSSDVENRIFKLEYRQEKEHKKAARAEQAIQQNMDGLSGTWHTPDDRGNIFRVYSSSSQLIIETIPRGVIRRAEYFRGQIVASHSNGASLTGRMKHWVIMCANNLGETQAEGEITSNWKKIVIQYLGDQIHLGPTGGIPSSQCTLMGQPYSATFELVRD